MKKTIILFSLFLILVAPAAHAQEASVTLQYRQTLLNLISLLMQQVMELQRQLLELQQKPPVLVLPVLPTVVPKETSYAEEAKPTVQITMRGYRWDNRQNNWGHEIYPENGVFYLQAADEPRLLISVGNPNNALNPGFTCEKYGNWSGTIEPNDHWEYLKSFSSGIYGVKCVTPSGYASLADVTFSVN